MLSRVFISAGPGAPLAFVFIFTQTDRGMFLLLVVVVKMHNAHIFIPMVTIPYHSYFFVRKRSLKMLSVSRVFISAGPSTPLVYVFVFTPTDQGMIFFLVV